MLSNGEIIGREMEGRMGDFFERNAASVASFTAASFVLGFIKIPSPVGSIALDSMPAYFSAAYIHPIVGGIVGALGHAGSAYSAGFPVGYIHILICLMMFVTCVIFGYIARSIAATYGIVVASGVAILLNGVIFPFCQVPFGVPIKIIYMILPLLSFAAALNVSIAAVAAVIITKIRVREG